MRISVTEVHIISTDLPPAGVASRRALLQTILFAEDFQVARCTKYHQVTARL